MIVQNVNHHHIQVGTQLHHDLYALRPDGAENIPFGSQVSDLCF